MYPYSDYAKHYIIGFIYTRNTDADEGAIYSLDELNTIPVPYNDVEVFVQEKYKISGEKPGSGNTENIGSFKTRNIDYLIYGEGPFSELGEAVYENYWANYPKYRARVREYTTIDEYIAWKEDRGDDMTCEKRIYEYWKQSHEE